jgi:hypothetical protein
MNYTLIPFFKSLILIFINLKKKATHKIVSIVERLWVYE